MNIPQSNPASKEQGSVLLETVIVLPLFLLLIGGIMWEGQLIYDKQKMVIADRYAAWNVGNRWNTDKDVTAGVQTFFPDKTHDEVAVVTASMDTVNAWYQEAWAGMSVTAKMPVWTEGLIDAGVVAYGASFPDNSEVMQGRDLASSSGSYHGHVVVMRSTIPDSRENPITPDDLNISTLNIPEAYNFNE